MNTPRFTAEASLYSSSGRYRTGRPAITLRARMNSLIAPARDEEIEVHGCHPGSQLVEYADGSWECKDDLGPWGGSGGIPGGPAPGGGGGPGPGPGEPPETPEIPEPQSNKPPTKKPYRPKDGKPCHAEIITDYGGDVIVFEPLINNGTYRYTGFPKYPYNCVSGDKTFACANHEFWDNKPDFRRWQACFNGHAKDW
jgi:hypothetical protein